MSRTELVGRSYLPEEMKRRYVAILRKRALTLERAARRLQEAAVSKGPHSSRLR